MKLKNFLFLCGFTALTGVTTQALAQSQHAQPSMTTPNVNMQNASKEPVVKLYQALSSIQKSSKSTLAQHTALLDKALDDSYDFPSIIEKTVGYRYNSFTQQEKNAVLAAFKKYTVARYLSSFAGDSDTKFTISPNTKEITSGSGFIISTTISADGDTTQINYIVHKTPQGWRIVDVLLNGNISQTAIQRGDFSSTLAKGGSQALIEMLDKKTQSFNKQQ